VNGLTARGELDNLLQEPLVVKQPPATGIETFQIHNCCERSEQFGSFNYKGGREGYHLCLYLFVWCQKRLGPQALVVVGSVVEHSYPVLFIQRPHNSYLLLLVHILMPRDRLKSCLLRISPSKWAWWMGL
jgi:hypothetical protein